MHKERLNLYSFTGQSERLNIGDCGIFGLSTDFVHIQSQKLVNYKKC